MRAWHCVQTICINLFNNCRAEVSGFCPGTSQGTIVLTGHSLGAAVATLAMYMLCRGEEGKGPWYRPADELRQAQVHLEPKQVKQYYIICGIVAEPCRATHMTTNDTNQINLPSCLSPTSSTFGARCQTGVKLQFQVGSWELGKKIPFASFYYVLLLLCSTSMGAFTTYARPQQHISVRQLRGYSVGLSYNFASPRVGNDAYHDAFATCASTRTRMFGAVRL